MSSADRVNENAAMDTGKKVAVLLIAHGSRRAEANYDLVEVADALRSQHRYHTVEISYLELAEPTIPEGCRTCAASGADCVLMLPYFLSAGQHVTRDLEQVRADSQIRFPDVAFRICLPLGRHPKLLEIINDRLAEGLATE